MRILNHINYSPLLINLFPKLEAYCIYINGIYGKADFKKIIDDNINYAKEKIKQHESESSLPSIKKWREAYRKVNTDPTKYRNATESLLRRLRINGNLPENLHPLVMLCNSFSVKYTIPIAALDIDKITNSLEVRFSNGSESYTTFNCEQITLPANEVTFVDSNNIAHARRWSHKQNFNSVITQQTKNALLIIESLIPFSIVNTDADIFDEIICTIKKEWPSASIEKVKIL